jgi:hypothetical protein
MGDEGVCHRSNSEFMIFLLSGHQELAAKQKPPTHQGGGLPLNGSRPSPTIRILISPRRMIV